MSVDMNQPAEGTTQQLAPVTAAPYQIPRVNLLPPEIGQAAAFKRTQLGSGLALGAVVLLLGAGFGLAVMDANRAADELATEQATTQQLTTEKGKYARVTEVHNEVEAVRGARQIAMTTDVLWSRQLDQIVTELPADMALKSLTVAFDADGGTAAATNPLNDPNTVGAISIEAYGPNHITTAAWLEAAAKHPGFANPYYSSSTYTDENGLVRTLASSNVRFTPEIYSGRYEPGGSKTVEAGKGN